MSRVFLVSRPRFWMYLFGPFLVGAAAALTHGGAFTPAGILLGLYFTLPANLLIYGVNDLFDYETDVLNAKKQGYEPLVTREHHRPLLRAILATNLPLIPLLFLLPTSAVMALAAFLFLGVFYSAKPIRAKAIPFLDSAFNVLYVMPGIAAFFAFGGSTLALPLVGAAMLWSMAMHAYSAAPDIAADRSAGIRTIATTLGKRATLTMCTVFFLSAAVVGILHFGGVGWYALGVYGGLMLRSFRAQTDDELLATYKQFPLWNTLVGAVLFFAIVLFA